MHDLSNDKYSYRQREGLLADKQIVIQWMNKFGETH